jgi:hypothetical protein
VTLWAFAAAVNAHIANVRIASILTVFMFDLLSL